MLTKFWNNNNFVSKNLKHYDKIVNRINCLYVWKCSENYIINHYRNNISSYHLEIGPGTGYFLKKENLRKNFSIQQLTLLDVNENILNYSKQNLKNDYDHKIITVHQDVFSKKINKNIKFNSVGINYVLHCIPGTLENNIDTLINNLGSSNYNLFGSTLICDPLHMNPIAEYELILLNNLGIFNNSNDTYEQFIEYLNNNKIKHNILKIGYVAIFNINI